MLYRLVILIIALLSSSPASAWNTQGHQIIALIAFDQSSPEVRAKTLDLVRKHPRFDQHFTGKMPSEVWNGSDAEKDGWLFAQAAVWPDLVRNKSDVVTTEDVQQFNRPTWHYVNHPVFLNESERLILEPSIRPNLNTHPPRDDDDDRFMNVVQAIRNSGGVVRDSGDDSQRAVHLCWLFHLVGDSHQPLHSCALFTSQRFPEGDKGGNEIMVRGKLNLHAYWDNAISRERQYNGVRRDAFDLMDNAELVAAGKEVAQTLKPTTWIQESYDLAKREVYTDHIRRLIAEAEGRENLGTMNPPKEYDRASATIADRRAVEAGFRLAYLLERLFPDDSTGGE